MVFLFDVVQTCAQFCESNYLVIFSVEEIGIETPLSGCFGVAWCSDQKTLVAKTLSKSSLGTDFLFYCLGEVVVMWTNVSHLSCAYQMSIKQNCYAKGTKK